MVGVAISEAKVAGAPRTHRKTVRIVESRSGSRTAAISFLITAAVAVLAIVVWVSTRETVEAPAVQRLLHEVILDWRCDNGHTLTYPGRIGPRHCEKCQGEMWPIATWSCENHHSHRVAVRLEIGPDGKPGPTEFRLRRRNWVPAGTVLNCPRCGQPLMPRVRDPYAGFPRKRRS